MQPELLRILATEVIGDTTPALSLQIIDTIANQPNIIEQVLSQFESPIVCIPLFLLFILALPPTILRRSKT